MVPEEEANITYTKTCPLGRVNMRTAKKETTNGRDSVAVELGPAWRSKSGSKSEGKSNKLRLLMEAVHNL